MTPKEAARFANDMCVGIEKRNKMSEYEDEYDLFMAAVLQKWQIDHGWDL